MLDQSKKASDRPQFTTPDIVYSPPPAESGISHAFLNGAPTWDDAMMPSCFDQSTSMQYSNSCGYSFASEIAHSPREGLYYFYTGSYDVGNHNCHYMALTGSQPWNVPIPKLNFFVSFWFRFMSTSIGGSLFGAMTPDGKYGFSVDAWEHKFDDDADPVVRLWIAMSHNGNRWQFLIGDKHDIDNNWHHVVLNMPIVVNKQGVAGTTGDDTIIWWDGSRLTGLTLWHGFVPTDMSVAQQWQKCCIYFGGSCLTSACLSLTPVTAGINVMMKQVMLGVDKSINQFSVADMASWCPRA